MYKGTFIVIVILLSLMELAMSQSFEEKQLEFTFTVNASPEDVYEAWTTAEGVKSFFAPECKVALEKYGDYHILFFPDAARGSRGAEDEIVLAYEKNKMFSFTWGFPPSLPELRATQKTVVLLRFTEIENGRTQVHFLQSGWGDGEDWQKGFDYFVDAWGNVVLARLRYRFDVGPVNWDNMPDISRINYP